MAVEIPSGWTPPSFSFQQRVFYEHERIARVIDALSLECAYESVEEIGTIVGLQYQQDDEHGPQGWLYLIELDANSPGFDPDSLEVIPEHKLTLLVHQQEPIAA